jgi:hypothetical protein
MVGFRRTHPDQFLRHAMPRPGLGLGLIEKMSCLSSIQRSRERDRKRLAAAIEQKVKRKEIAMQLDLDSWR